MATVSVGSAIRAALGGKLDEAAALSRRWAYEVGEITDRVHGLRRAAAAIDAEELTEPLDAAYKHLQEAYLVMFLAWRRLDR